MNREKVTSLIAGVVTVSSMFLIGIMTYLYWTNRFLFKWCFLSLVVMGVSVVMYSSLRNMVSETYKQDPPQKPNTDPLRQEHPRPWD